MPRPRRVYGPIVPDARQYRQIVKKPIHRGRFLLSTEPIAILRHFDDIRSEANEENSRESHYHTYCVIPRGRSGGDYATYGEDHWTLDEFFLHATKTLRLRRRYVRLASGKHGVFVSLTVVPRANLPEPQEEPNSPAFFDEEDLSD